MKREAPVNLPASVHQRLLNLSQQRGEEFNLDRGFERFPHADPDCAI